MVPKATSRRVLVLSVALVLAAPLLVRRRTSEGEGCVASKPTRFGCSGNSVARGVCPRVLLRLLHVV